MSNAFHLTINYVESSIREDEMGHSIFPEPDTFLLIASEIPSFVFIHLNPLSMKIIVSYTPEIDDKSESVSSIEVCCIHRALSFSKSFEDLFLHISCLHSLTVNLIEIPLAATFTSVMSGLNVLTVSRTSDIRLVNRRIPFIDALIDGGV